MPARTYVFTGNVPIEFTLIDYDNAWTIIPDVERRTWYGRRKKFRPFLWRDGRSNTVTVNFQ